MSDSAYYYANKALRYAHSVKNRNLIYRSYIILTSILYMQGDHQKAYQNISQSLKYIPKDVKHIATYYCWKGLLHQEMGQIDSAHYYWEYGRSISPQIDYFFYQNIFQTEKELGNWKNAVEMADSCISSYYSIQSFTRQEEMGNVLNKHKLGQYALQHQKKYNLLLVSCIIILMISIIVIMWMKKRYKNQYITPQNKPIKYHNIKDSIDIKSTNNDIKELKTNTNQAHISIELIQCIQNKSKQYIAIFQDTEAYKWIIDIEQLIQKKEKEKHEWFMNNTDHENSKEIKLSNENRIKLEKTIHKIFAEIIADLHKSCPRLTNEDMIYCIFLLLRINNKVISICMSVSSSTFRMRKSRIRTRIGPQSFKLLFSNK